MALQSSGAISLSDIQTEFLGTNPISLSEYYDAAGGIPSSGAIDFSDFYGKSRISIVDTNSTYSTGGALTTHSFAADFSTAETGRLIVVTVNMGDNNATSATGMTIGGVTATEVVTANHYCGYYASEASIWVAAVPTGTSGTVSLTTSTGSQASMQVFALYGATSATPVSTDTSTDTTSHSFNVSGLPSNAAVIGTVGAEFSTSVITTSWSATLTDAGVVGTTGGNSNGSAYNVVQSSGSESYSCTVGNVSPYSGRCVAHSGVIAVWG